MHPYSETGSDLTHYLVIATQGHNLTATYKSEYDKFNKPTCTFLEDSDQPAQPHSLVSLCLGLQLWGTNDLMAAIFDD